MVLPRPDIPIEDILIWYPKCMMSNITCWLTEHNNNDNKKRSSKLIFFLTEANMFEQTLHKGGPVGDPGAHETALNISWKAKKMQIKMTVVHWQTTGKSKGEKQI